MTDFAALRGSLGDIAGLLAEVGNISGEARADLAARGDNYSSANMLAVRSHLLAALGHVRIAEKFLDDPDATALQR